MRWYTVSRLGDHTSLTPEGFLLVEDVPIARTGQQIYWENEIAELDADDKHQIVVDRDPSEVFREDSIASFQGKPIVNDHPFIAVNPDNHRDLAIGHMQNVHRGTGSNDDVLIADLLFTTRDGIKLVEGGKRALSVGYDAYYERIARGRGRQRNIIANHVALVDEGRCGHRCTILDGSPVYSDAFVESEHPRDDEGMFAAGGTGHHVYHGTLGEHLSSIAKHGLRGDPNLWVTSTPEAARAYVSSFENPQLLRMHRSHVPNLEYSGESRHGGTNEKTSGRIRPEHIEHLQGGVWRKLASAAIDRFVESEHPRVSSGSNAGEFTSGGGGGATTGHQTTKVINGKRVTVSGGELPEHIAKLKIPPAWRNVTYNPDPEGHLLVTGVDAKNRRQSLYSEAHHAKQAAGKFARIRALEARFDAMHARNAEAMKSSDPRTRAAAEAMALVMHTGMRPGSEADTGAEHKGYGATTLEGRHVVSTEGGDVSLQYVPGKKHGANITMPITDRAIAKMLLRRKKAAGDTGQLFEINASALREHVHGLEDSGKFKTKDFRTLLGTRTAMTEIARMQPPADAKAYKRAVMTVAKTVSNRLGNTPAIALQSYINPAVFAHWQAGMQASGAGDAEPPPPLLPEAHWGEIDAPLPDWREAEDPDPDDELMVPTPEDVIAGLGFDPALEEDPAATADCNCKETIMSKRTMAEWFRDAFHARDKATLDKLIADAEKEDEDKHDEPETEGHHVHVHIEGGDAKPKTGDEQDPDVEKRLKNLEDSVASIKDSVAKMVDAIKGKDAGNPFAKKEGEDDETKDAPEATEGALSSEGPGGVAGAELMEADPALKTGKSMMGDAAMVGRWNTAIANWVRDTASRAEVLSPGIKITGNLDAGGVKALDATGKAVCDLSRASLLAAMKTDQGKAAIGRHVSEAAVNRMSCDAVRMTFLAASDAMRDLNNAAGRAQPGGTFTGEDPRAFNDRQRATLAGINKANREFWSKQTGRSH